MCLKFESYPEMLWLDAVGNLREEPLPRDFKPKVQVPSLISWVYQIWTQKQTHWFDLSVIEFIKKSDKYLHILCLRIKTQSLTFKEIQLNMFYWLTSYRNRFFRFKHEFTSHKWHISSLRGQKQVRMDSTLAKTVEEIRGPTLRSVLVVLPFLMTWFLWLKRRKRSTKPGADSLPEASGCLLDIQFL